MADHEIKGWGWDAVWVRRGGEKGKSHVRIQKWRMNKETWIKQGLFDCRETGQLDAIARMYMYLCCIYVASHRFKPGLHQRAAQEQASWRSHDGPAAVELVNR